MPPQPTNRIESKPNNTARKPNLEEIGEVGRERLG
jgi:hypothetical protein